MGSVRRHPGITLTAVVIVVVLLMLAAAEQAARGQRAASVTGAATITAPKQLGYTGGEHQYVVPSGVTLVGVAVQGAWGGADNGFGQAGQFIKGFVAVTPGQTLYAEVGQNGSYKGGPAFGGGGNSGPTACGNGTAAGQAMNVQPLPSGLGTVAAPLPITTPAGIVIPGFAGSNLPAVQTIAGVTVAGAGSTTAGAGGADGTCMNGTDVWTGGKAGGNGSGAAGTC
jgi:hypothetical protein